MALHRIVEGEPGIFPPGPRELLRWLRGRRAPRDQEAAAPEAPRDATSDEPEGPGPATAASG